MIEMKFRVWFCDLEKAIPALRAVVTDDMFCSITGNFYGDLLFTLRDGKEYIVKHGDFSVWEVENGETKRIDK